MRICTEQDLPDILALLRSDLAVCIYLYLDVVRYGLSHPRMRLWLERREGAVCAVLMQYFDSMHVYALPGADLDALAAQIAELKPAAVTGTPEVCGPLSDRLGASYALSCGWVCEVKKFPVFPCPAPIEVPSDEDLKVCARLICQDETLGGQYTPEALAVQLAERRREGMGRNFMVRRQGRIIGHIATYAECENLAVYGGFIVHPDFRGQHLGTGLESFLISQLLSEGKRVFSFIRKTSRLKYFKALGITDCRRTARLSLC